MQSTTTLLGLFFCFFFIAAALEFCALTYENSGGRHAARATYPFSYVNYSAQGFVTPVKDQSRTALPRPLHFPATKKYNSL